ncbi:unnamed protein product [Orchesella dallaii]|uniref:Gustatory receptor n=1 Tax=Orchesella dallaii TaxID=48710 RepID=A0ABP1R6G1_9HEXA
MCWRLSRQRSTVICILNWLMNFEREMDMDYSNSPPPDMKGKLVKFIVKMLVLTEKFLPIFMSALSGLDPSFPTNIFEFMHNENARAFQISPYIYRVLLMLGNYLVWHIISTIGMFFSLEMLITFEIVRNYVFFVMRFSETRTYPKWYRVSKFYRKIQLLMQLFNETHAGSIMLYLLLVACSGQIICSYVSIRSSGIPLPIVIILILETIDAYVIIIGVYEFAADVNTTSSKLVEKLRRRRDGKTGIVQKFMDSLPVLRVGFGSANHIDKSTPLVFVNFNHARLVDLLLLKQ